MVQRQSFTFPTPVCDTCIEAAFEYGAGDLSGKESIAAIICADKGDNFAEHECEQFDCKCACLSDFDREIMEEEKDDDESLEVQ